MKALSIRQPWAELILQGKKKIEIRTWNTNFRGDFLIHASKNTDRALIRYFNLEDKQLNFGEIVGYVRLAKVIAYNSATEVLKDAELHLSLEKKEKYPVYGFVLEDVRQISPIKCNGRLGFFEVPEISLSDLRS
jgi:predicted transcriptional regulator